MTTADEQCPGNGIDLVILDYAMFKLKSSKRLLRDVLADEQVVRRALQLKLLAHKR